MSFEKVFYLKKIVVLTCNIYFFFSAQYRGYKLKTKDRKDLNVLMCDSMGLEPGDAGLNMDEIDDILDGRVKDGQKVRNGL